MTTTRPSPLPSLFMLAVLGAGCGPRVNGGQQGGGTTSGSSPTSGTSSTGFPVTTTTTTGGATSPGDTTAPPPATSGTSTGGTSGSFLHIPDGGSVDRGYCSEWDQDCASARKCSAWANDGSDTWNSVRCVPLDPAPASAGDPCTVENSAVSGVDDCDESSKCWNVDPATLGGTCVPLCGGTNESPTCADGTACAIANDAVLILCLPTCDPLGQDCPAGQACGPVGDAVVCMPDASGGTGSYGDSCQRTNGCDPGLTCVSADAVPGCSDPVGCCSPLCDLSDPGASASCPGAADGQACVPVFADGMAPSGQENLGACSAGSNGSPLLMPILEAPS